MTRLLAHLEAARAIGKRRLRHHSARRAAAAPACPLDGQLDQIHADIPDIAPRSQS